MALLRSNNKFFLLSISVSFIGLLTSNNFAKKGYFYPLNSYSQADLISSMKNSDSQNEKIDIIKTDSIENFFTVTKKQPKN